MRSACEGDEGVVEFGAAAFPSDGEALAPASGGLVRFARRLRRSGRWRYSCRARPRPAWRGHSGGFAEQHAPIRWPDDVDQEVPVTSICAEPERLARFWCEVLGYVVPQPPEGFATGTTTSARFHLSSRTHGLPAVIPQAWARDCTSSAFPKGRPPRTGCILTCGSAPDSWVKSASPHLRPSAHDWSRSARGHTCNAVCR